FGFESLAQAGRSALTIGDATGAAETLRRALELWHGTPVDVSQIEALRLEEIRLTALEDRIDADLALGRHAQLVGELEGLVAEHPLRERLPGPLMMAVYRAGRHAAALAVYQRARRSIWAALGVEPGW